MAKVGVVSLGCDKNRVDSEIMLYNLRRGGFEITNDPSEAEIIIVNTCAFLESARQEAIETTLEMARYKHGKCKKLIMTGCLPQRFISEMFDEFTEVDGFLGTNDYADVVSFRRCLTNLPKWTAFWALTITPTSFLLSVVWTSVAIKCRLTHRALRKGGAL